MTVRLPKMMAAPPGLDPTKCRTMVITVPYGETIELSEGHYARRQPGEAERRAALVESLLSGDIVIVHQVALVTVLNRAITERHGPSPAFKRRVICLQSASSARSALAGVSRRVFLDHAFLDYSSPALIEVAQELAERANRRAAERAIL